MRDGHGGRRQAPGGQRFKAPLTGHCVLRCQRAFQRYIPKPEVEAFEAELMERREEQKEARMVNQVADPRAHRHEDRARQAVLSGRRATGAVSGYHSRPIVQMTRDVTPMLSGHGEL
jgi:hypothetical protein